MEIQEIILHEIISGLDEQLKDLFSPNKKPNFDQIEAKVLKIRQEFGEKLTQKVLNFQNQNTAQKKTAALVTKS